MRLDHEVGRIGGQLSRDERAVGDLHGDRLSVDEPDLVAAVDGGLGPEPDMDGVHAPAVAGIRRAERASAPPGERAEHRLERAAVLGQLVDGHGPRRRELRLPHDAGALEVAQAGGEDVRADPGQRIGEVGVAPLAEHELADHEELPPVADLVEGMCHRAVLAVALHNRIVCLR